MNKTEYIPKSLQDIWIWKDEIRKEVQHLNTKDALHEIMNKAKVAANDLGFIPDSYVPHSLSIAESSEEYIAKT